MGFQSAFNQLLATAAGGVAAGKHLYQQKQAQVTAEKANEMAAWKEASSMSEEGHELVSQALENNQLTEETNKKKAVAETQRDLDKSHFNEYVSQNAPLSKGQKQYARKLMNNVSAQARAVENYQMELDKLESRRQTLVDRREILRGRIESAPESISSKIPNKIRENVVGGKK